MLKIEARDQRLKQKKWATKKAKKTEIRKALSQSNSIDERLIVQVEGNKSIIYDAREILCPMTKPNITSALGCLASRFGTSTSSTLLILIPFSQHCFLAAQRSNLGPYINGKSPIPGWRNRFDKLFSCSWQALTKALRDLFLWERGWIL